MAKSSFPGFPLDLLHFLDELSKNNNRKWFTANKDRYERVLRQPAISFIEAMAEPCLVDDLQDLIGGSVLLLTWYRGADRRGMLRFSRYP